MGAGFGADLMENAYNFMNSVTGTERRMLEVAFMDIFTVWAQQFVDYTIAPLTYITNQVTTPAP